MGQGKVARGLFVAVGCVAAAVAACSGVETEKSSDPKLGSEPTTTLVGDGQGNVGSVTMHLDIGPGTSVTSVDWTITNGVNTYSGEALIGDAQSVEFAAGGILAGSGYTVTLTATDSQGDPCSGASAPFSVSAGAVTQVVLAVVCTAPPDGSIAADVTTGPVEVDAGVSLVVAPQTACPGISAFSISPAEINPSQTASLAVQTIGPAASITWSVSPAGGGTFGNASAANTTFACSPGPSQVTVTATAGLPDSGVCAGQVFTTMSAFVNCEPQCTTAAGCPASTTACKVPVCTGTTCGFSNAAQGAACSDSGGSICDGAGTCVTPSFDVVRLGNGSAVTAGVTVPVFIDRYSLTGALLGSTPLPTAVSGSNQPLTLVGSEVSEGDLTTSVDGRFLVMAGHNYAPGATVSAANCGVAFIGSGATPTVNTSIQLPLALAAGGLVRSAASLDGTQVWVTGAATGTTGGLWYMPGDVQVVQTSTAKQGRDVRIAGGQLYADSNAIPPGLFTVGTGTPITGSPAPTLTELPGLPTSGSASPYAFVFLTVNGVQTLYVADDQGNGLGGVVKYTLSGGSWTKVGAATGVSPGTDGGAGTAGYRGLAGYVTGTTVTLMASTGMTAGGQDELVVIVDTGTGSPSQTPVRTSAANETFRGIAVPPHP
jgi:hypothetical protein